MESGKLELVDTENILVVDRGGGWQVDEMWVGYQNIKTSRYKMNNSWGCNVQHSDYKK